MAEEKKQQIQAEEDERELTDAELEKVIGGSAKDGAEPDNIKFKMCMNMNVV